ncbi:TetR/AcrR family transcriptional regulator [Clostridium estertheticum]|nr:TetR/AcrR family transcriptional regulator [Clostridium estertheticum]
MLETKRQKQKKLTKKHLIEIAIKQFGENGIITTPTADIAKAAKVSHGTVFAHFSTQEELLISVIEEFGNRITQRLHELVDTNSSLFEVLEAHIEGLIEFEPFYTRLIIERRLLPESVCNTYIMIQSTISFHISIAAEKEIKQGTIRKVPIHLIYNTWIGLIHYYITNGDLFSPNGSVLKQYRHELLQHYINLITK